MKTRTIIEYLLAVVLVLILGSLTGWYFFLRTQTKTTALQSAARGYGAAIPQGNADGGASSLSSNADAGGASISSSQTNPTPSTGFFSNLWNALTGRGGIAAQPSGVSSFNDDSSPFSDTSGVQQPASQTAKPVQRPAQLWQVEEKPTAGHIFVGSGGNLRLRYVERAGGYVFDANPETGLRARLTNTLMPKIYEAQLSENGHIFERSVDTLGNITTFAGTVSTSTGASSASSSAMTLLGSYLPKNIVNLSTHPVSGTLLYTIANTGGGAVVSADWDGQKAKTLFSSAILSWRPSILADGRVFLAQAAADGVPGYAYELKKDAVLVRLLGPVPGLVVRVRPSQKGDADTLLWSQSAGGDLRLFVRVGQNATAVQIPVRTTADKCVWFPGKDYVAYCGVPHGSTGQNFLYNWYRGAAHSSDSLWRVDASAGTAELVFTPSSNTPVDIEDITVDRAGSALAFTNATDKSLWLFRLVK